jgi:tetratricopeptide (TPR) repeat protein
VDYYTKAIEKDSYLYESLLNRGVSYVKLNKYNEAKADLKKVIDECKDTDLVENATKSYDPIKNITIITKK